jgi:hypothetical protein
MRVPSTITNAWPALLAPRTAVRSFGARAANRGTTSSTYLQAVVVPDSETGRQLGERLSLAQVGEHKQGC